MLMTLYMLEMVTITTDTVWEWNFLAAKDQVIIEMVDVAVVVAIVALHNVEPIIELLLPVRFARGVSNLFFSI